MRIYKNQLFLSDVSFAVHLPDELQNPNIQHIKRLNPRATSVPSHRKNVFYRNKEESDLIYSLNGDYKFALFDDEAPKEFEKDNFDDGNWDILDVPSMWQFRGYAEPTYPNTEYPFPFDPPYINRVNPVGCYRRHFNLDKKPNRTILHFEGVDSAFYVYINGEFAGFSKGSRLSAEFDVSDLVCEGENLIAVKVYTYCDGSYLENQDMLLASGIFRDVYLLMLGDTAVWDYEIITDDKTLSLSAELFEESKDTFLRIGFDGFVTEIPFDGKEVKFTYSPENVKLWNAEEPNLYDLTLEVIKDSKIMEIHNKRIGFVTSEISNNQFLINGSPVVFRGVNRHENNCENGRFMTVQQIYDDLLLLINSNVNAIRCSHYPNNPAFYELCSEMGIYVMDEGDIESHGCGITGDQGYLNKNPEWLNAFTDRTVRMAQKDKNETCIVIWSVGNENGTGDNAEKCAEYLRNLPKKKPIMYTTEGNGCSFYGAAYCNSVDFSKSVDDSKKYDKPVLLIEYAHAMGNSPGGLEQIWDVVMDNPEYTCGGFVWEFRSHGMKRKNKDGSVDYLYGGDFHDDNHWTNFSLDGYLTSDGTPKPTFYDLKYIYSPIRFSLKENKLNIFNRYDFIDTSGLNLETEYFADGKTVNTEKMIMPVIKAGNSKSIIINDGFSGFDRFVTVRVYKEQNKIAEKQFALLPNMEKKEQTTENHTMNIESDNDKIVISGKDFVIKFENGVPNYYQKNGLVYFDEPMRIVTHRAEIDNDGIRGLFPRWISVWEDVGRLHKMRFFSRNTTVEKGKEIKITVYGVLSAEHCFTGFSVKTEYTVFSDGLIRVNMRVCPYGRMPEWRKPDTYEEYYGRLPRFGVCFALKKEFNNVKWYGRGENQNYDDSTASAPIGVYSLPIEKMNFEYDMPQETGSRCDTRYVQIKKGNDNFVVYGNDLFTFSYHPWSLENLRFARHKSDLKEDSVNHLYIDYKMRPLGSLSCGPNPEARFDFIPHDFMFSFAIGAEDSEEPKHFLEDLGEKTKKLTECYTYKEIVTARSIIECKE